MCHLFIFADLEQMVKVVKQGKYVLLMDRNTQTRTEMIAVSLTLSRSLQATLGVV